MGGAWAGKEVLNTVSNVGGRCVCGGGAGGWFPRSMKNALDTSWMDYTSTALTLLELASEFQSSQFKGSVLQGNDRG